MNAINFIKDHGVDRAKECLPNYEKHYCGLEQLFVEDLKRLVESVDLLKSNGGYEEAKDTFDFAIKHGMNDLTEFGSRLKQAIADYEQIYGDSK